MKEKFGLYQRYNLGGQHYHSFFEFDFINNKARLVSQGITEDIRKAKGIMFEDEENAEIAKSLFIPDNFKEFGLSKEIMDEISLKLGKFKQENDETLVGIWGLSEMMLNEKNDSGNHIKEYFNSFPDSWIDFGNYMIDTLGFDLLNVNSGKLITNLNYDIRADGVYNSQSKEKLSLRKVNYHISSIQEPFNPFNFTIDSNDENFDKILELLERYGVYKWSDKDYLENISESDDFNDFKGNSWFIELIFDDGKVLNLRGDNAFPDTYVHLGEEVLQYGEDFLRIKEIDEDKREFIKSFGENKTSDRRDLIGRIDFSQYIYLNGWNCFDFSIDCFNSTASQDISVQIPYDMHIRDLLGVNNNILESFSENALKSEVKLDPDKLDAFLKGFNKLDFSEVKEDSFNHDKNHIRNDISLHYSWGDVSYNLTNYPEMWKELGGLLIDLFGFDILNIENSRKLVSNLYYDIREDGVYDRQTGEKLKLKAIEYGHGPVLSIFIIYNIFVDLENRKTFGFINKENLGDDEIDYILELLEKNHVYEWISDDLWQKAKNHHWMILDGYRWYLTLTFEGDIVFNLEGGNEYPDTFIHLAKDVIEFSGKDILQLKTLTREERKLIEKYGDLKLSE